MSKQIRLIFGKTEQLIAAPSDFAELKLKVALLFALSFSGEYKIYYNDSDGDLITVTNSDDYSLALGQEGNELTFYVSNTSECARELISTSNGPKFSPVQSCYEEVKAAEHPDVKIVKPKPLIDTYACLGCNGRKTNSKGTKSCKLCLGTGRVTDEFLEKVRSIIRTQLSAELEPQFMIAASQLLESQTATNLAAVKKELAEEKQKTMPEPATYSITASNQKVEYSSKLIKELPSNDFALKPGKKFEKIWTLKNTGNCPWPISTRFRYAGGDHIETITSPVGDIKPGDEVEVSMKGLAPSVPGHYVMYCRLIHGESQGFGERPWIDITVAH